MVVGIVGMGLMGGSFGRLLLKNTKYTVYGADRSEESLSKALLVNAMHAPLNEENAREVDLLIVSVYPRGFFAAAKPWLPLLKEGAAVLDFCGVKRKVTEEMRALAEQFPQLSFIGGHPMAGREFWGIEHAVPSLFERASMILVPVSVSLEKISHLKGLFLSLGFSRVVVTTAEKHDADDRADFSARARIVRRLCAEPRRARIRRIFGGQFSGYDARRQAESRDVDGTDDGKCGLSDRRTERADRTAFAVSGCAFRPRRRSAAPASRGRGEGKGTAG